MSEEGPPQGVMVCVRLRPLWTKGREANCKNCVEMNGNVTILNDPKGEDEPRKYAFDRSYWSFDGFKDDGNGVFIPDSPSSKYTSQEMVWDDLGKVVLTNSMEGYNCTEFRKIGDGNRTVRKTGMNDSSSRGHTVFTIRFTEQTNESGEWTDRFSSKINLVDLAGSERPADTGLTGIGLEEGVAINVSLSALGRVITQLADGENRVDYRACKLTHLLSDALNGQAVTILIAALSPADINYDDSLSTLRFADNCKKIPVKVVKQLSATEVLIQNLKEENKKLKKLLKKAGARTHSCSVDTTGMFDDDGEEEDEGDDGGDDGGEDEDVDPAELVERRAAIKMMLDQQGKDFETRSKEAGDELADLRKALNDHGLSAKEILDTFDDASPLIDTESPVLVNLGDNGYDQSCLMWIIADGETIVKRRVEGDESSGIKIPSQDISPEGHAKIAHDDTAKTDTISPIGDNATFINGEALKGAVVLTNGDRVVFGASTALRYLKPSGKGPISVSGGGQGMSLEDALKEIVQKNESTAVFAAGAAAIAAEDNKDAVGEWVGVKEHDSVKQELEEKKRECEELRAKIQQLQAAGGAGAAAEGAGTADGGDAAQQGGSQPVEKKPDDEHLNKHADAWFGSEEDIKRALVEEQKKNERLSAAVPIFEEKLEKKDKEIEELKTKLASEKKDSGQGGEQKKTGDGAEEGEGNLNSTTPKPPADDNSGKSKCCTIM
uniref:Kinesin-like protein n=1 Tax=Chromera velia CCMP2878 TaxID=1169474 RepID=A0A0G4F1U5_9ALVE|eukprot:Cvel_14645.t1-p1 / transcript=Cvel_14645.t1 / gene=Cvel_14645 / organism=Chromera_velia_CCMP2878 / gene_product=Kinesin-like protein unc-104, putative / transcript_product=Kinesin-like protein unc-104, putative / location=Cvel_scaffold1048:41075-51642(-) / protein_length=720 / sequence_SO=supercontig / SO=protein_coding / is_pseudo=false